jgi:hypothetical protein
MPLQGIADINAIVLGVQLRMNSLSIPTELMRWMPELAIIALDPPSHFRYHIK